MHAGGASTPSHYDVLGVAPDASQEEVRRAFHRAALRTHPDKAPPPGTAAVPAAPQAMPAPSAAASGAGAPGSGPTEPVAASWAAAAALASAQLAAAAAAATAPEGAMTGGEEYLRVQEAWAVLSDPGQRAAYDQQLQLAAAAQQVAVSDTVPLAVLQPAEVEGESCLVWPCRCGGCFAVTAEEAAAAAKEAAAAAAGSGEGAAEGASSCSGAGELLLPCTTCSLYILVHLPAAGG